MMLEIERVLLAELLEWYRLQRHDFLNHWQVIIGNLQLNQPEKALKYMRAALTGVEQEQKIGQISEPQLAAILLGFMIRLRQEGITTTIDFPDAMKQDYFWQEHWREEYVEGLYGYTSECLEESRHSMEALELLNSEVYLYDEPGGLSCQFILADEETVLIDKMVKFTITSTSK